MTLVPVHHTPRILLAADDPLETHLLRSLLRSLAEPRPELVVAEIGSPAWTAALTHCELCLLPLADDVHPLANTLAEIRTSAPRMRIVGMLGARARFGDRAELIRALRAGMSEVVLLEELSLSTLRELLTPRHATNAVTHELAPTPRAIRVASPTPDATDPVPTPGSIPLTGSWRITLSEQRATFDAAALERLGYAAGTIGSTLGDWKALIHPDDIDRLVAEVHGVLNGSAPPYPVAYRLQAHDGTWVAVASDDISVELDEHGNPRAISGRFYTTHAAHPAETPEPGALAPPREVQDAVSAHLDMELTTAVLRLRRDASAAFRVIWCNPAAGALEQREPALLHGLRAGEFSPSFDGFDLEDALARVYQTGIAEACEVMTPGRDEQPHWRSYHITRLDDGDLLIEASDISEHVNQRMMRRMHDEMAQYLVRALPLSALLLDEQARVVQVVSVAGGALGNDVQALENHLLAELFGAVAGAACREQIQKTLNTGRIASAIYEIDSSTGRQWLACHSAVVRGRPGMPQRALLTVQDVSEPVRELAEARLARDQLNAALRRIPVPLFLKDLDGRYLAINPAFGDLYGIEESMLLGKTDLEVFPDELAMELHEAEQRICSANGSTVERRIAGQGERRTDHCWFGFTVGEPGHPDTGSGCLLVPLDTLTPNAEAAQPPTATPQQMLHCDCIEDATASVVERVEQVLVEAGDYSEVLRRLEHLAETTMHAQALIHEVAGKTGTGAATPPTLLAPLAQNIIDLERIVLPAAVRLESEFAPELPPAHCEPLVFHQILLRGIRHARRGLPNDGTLVIELRPAHLTRGACLSCREGFSGHHVEMVIRDSGTMLQEHDLRTLASRGGEAAPVGSPLGDLIQIHELVHGQGGHLQVQQSAASGNSLHIYFRAASTDSNGSRDPLLRSTVARFPFVRLRDPRGSF